MPSVGWRRRTVQDLVQCSMLGHVENLDCDAGIGPGSPRAHTGFTGPPAPANKNASTAARRRRDATTHPNNTLPEGSDDERILTPHISRKPAKFLLSSQRRRCHPLFRLRSGRPAHPISGAGKIRVYAANEFPKVTKDRTCWRQLASDRGAW